MSDRAAMIRDRLVAALGPARIEVVDESHLHAGHAGARDGRGHFRATIIAECFAGETAVGRHRLVYSALGELMRTDIHALSITALAPGESG
jgi:BolA protein